MPPAGAASTLAPGAGLPGAGTAQPTRPHVTASKTGLSALPPVDRVLDDPRVSGLADRCDRRVLAGLVRDALAGLREDLLEGRAPGDREALIELAVAGVREGLDRKLAPRLGQVVNATGIVLHTNLGRAPLAASALRRIAETASGYCDLEIDLDTGGRGSRHRIVEELLCELTGAEAAAVVNNNAAAVLATLNSLALGREAVVSRGQLIEIGGSFRLPDVMARSGAVPVEVGTTNRTHLADYEAAISERTGLLLDAHTSNYRVLGFTASVPLEELAALGRRHGVPVACDLGGGALIDLTELGLPAEPLVADSVAAGADVVTFSGDKILGGPQAGLIVGRRESIEAILSNPLMRALRCGKLTYAALEATLRLHLDRSRLLAEHPVLSRLTVKVSTLKRRGRRLRGRLADLREAGWRIELIDSRAQAGSGSLPLEEIPSAALAVKPPALPVEELGGRLRRHDPPVLGYVRGDRLHLDLRAVAAAEIAVLESALRRGSVPP